MIRRIRSRFNLWRRARANLALRREAMRTGRPIGVL